MTTILKDYPMIKRILQVLSSFWLFLVFLCFIWYKCPALLPMILPVYIISIFVNLIIAFFIQKKRKVCIANILKMIPVDCKKYEVNCVFATTFAINSRNKYPCDAFGIIFTASGEIVFKGEDQDHRRQIDIRFPVTLSRIKWEPEKGECSYFSITSRSHDKCYFTINQPYFIFSNEKEVKECYRELLKFKKEYKGPKQNIREIRMKPGIKISTAANYISIPSHLFTAILLFFFIFFSGSLLLMISGIMESIWRPLTAIALLYIDFGITALFFKFVPERCGKCGGAMYGELSAPVIYKCLRCGHISDTGFTFGRR